MGSKYTEGFIEQALTKVYSRGDRTIRSVAEDMNINYRTLEKWMGNGSTKNMSDQKEKRPQDWSSEEKFNALQKGYALSGEALQKWCREQGLFVHHLDDWKKWFCSIENDSKDKRESKRLRDENEGLKRELMRKDKALSEAAALLILQKKFQAFWEAEAK